MPHRVRFSAFQSARPGVVGVCLNDPRPRALPLPSSLVQALADPRPREKQYLQRRPSGVDLASDTLSHPRLPLKTQADLVTANLADARGTEDMQGPDKRVRHLDPSPYGAPREGQIRREGVLLLLRQPPLGNSP